MTDFTQTRDEIRDLVLSRLMTIPPNLKLSIGNHGSFDNVELAQHVEKNDAIGEAVVKMHMAYLRSLKTRYL